MLRQRVQSVAMWQPDLGNKKRSLLSSIFLRYRKNKMAMVGLVIFLVILFFAIFAGVFVNYETDVIRQNARERLLPASSVHLLGTDMYGRDLFARLIWGARLSLMISLSVVTLSLVIGSLMGAIAAYKGGVLDTILMRVVDIFLAIPTTLMAVTVVAALGTGITKLILALTISMVPPFARIVRSTVLQVKGSDYIEAAVAYGANDSYILAKHIMLNAIGPLIVQATLNLATVLLSVAALGFIGLGVPSPQPEWGTMLAESKAQMRYYPHLIIYPGVAIIMAVLSINLIGDGLRDALDPRLKN